MTITIATDDLFELAQKQVERDRARDNCLQAMKALERAKYASTSAVNSRRSASDTANQSIRLDLLRNKPVDWQVVEADFAQIEAAETQIEETREAFKQATATLYQAREAADESRDLFNRQVDEICQPARKSLRQAERNFEVAQEATKEVARELAGAKDEAIARIERVGLAGLATDESSQTEIDQAREAIHRTEGELNQLRKTMRSAEEKLDQARRDYDTTKAGALAAVTQVAGALSRRAELVSA